MKSYLVGVVLGFAIGSEALVARTSCCFGLSVSGGPTSGTVGQLSDGQNRVGGGLPAATFCISNGEITDSSGRGCFLTPPTSQFQCDVGASPEAGFAIGCDGTLTFDGSSTFFECNTGDNGEFNINLQPVDNEACSPVKLTADNCHSCPSSTAAASSTMAMSTAAHSSTLATSTGVAVPSSSCPATLTQGSFEFPHLIVPIHSDQPNTAFGTSFNGQVSSTVSSIFNFDIPQSDAGKTCTLMFLFPTQAELQTSSFTFSGNGAIDFSRLSSPASGSTTFSNAPSVSADLGTITVSPGHAYTIASVSCPAGKTASYKMSNAGSTDFTWFQDFNPCPIGLFITVS